MPKVKISEFSSTPANNTDIDSINISEGCAPSGINDAIRELMSQLKDFQVGSAGDPVTVGGVLTVQAGAVGTPAITTAGDTNTGIFFPAADTIAFAEGGVEAARIDSSGNLGLGVTPSAWSLGKAIEVGFAGKGIWANNQNEVIAPNNAYFNSGWKYAITGFAPSQYAQRDGLHAWSTAPSGTAGNAITFTQAMTLDASGNLGVGTTSPASRLDVNGKITLRNGSDARLGYIKNESGALFIGSETSGITEIIFQTNGPTERARIDSSGNLLVGGTSAKGKNYTYQSANSIGLGVETTGGGYTSNVFQTGVYGTIAGSGFNHIACLNANAQTIFAVRGDGFVYTPNLGAATGTAVVLNSNGFLYTQSSSIRYKKDVAPIDIGLDFILGLNPVKYNLIETNEPQIGFIAEDFTDTRLVSMSKVDKQDDSKGLQAESVNYAQIVAPLVKAIQEQQALITALTARITALESN